MKKAFGQTVREIKREVNKKVLKVPGVEQKVLDATSNEPWGPHGTLLADIAQASRNYHEYQMIMQVIWKRINDTGKNWRHVYKGLTVLEYLVAHGSERVIDDIREHAYQISTLSDFQYIDSNGRDQGSNVRKKSQSLVVLVNDKERIQEVRQKAAANRDKFRNTSMGGMYRPGSGGYGDDDRNGYGREREWGDDRYGDRQSRDSDERYSREDDYRGRSPSVDGDGYNSTSKSSDREKNQNFEDDAQYSSRGSGAKADDPSQDGSNLNRKLSEPYLNGPPSYEEAVGEAQSPAHSERGGEVPVETAPKAPAPVSTNSTKTDATSAPPASASASASPPVPASLSPPAPSPANKEIDSFDEFDPRGPFTVDPTPTTSTNADMDLLGSLSDAFAPNPLAIMPATPTTAVSEGDASASFSSETTFAAALSASQPFDDPFGDGPFRAIPTSEPPPAQPQSIAPTSSFDSISELPQNSVNPYGEVPTTMNSFTTQDFSTSGDDTFDILADILPPSGPPPPVNSQTSFPPQQQTNFPPQQQTSFPPQQQTSFPPQQQASFPPQQQASFPPQQQTSFPPQQQTSFPPQQQTSFPPQSQASFPPQQQTSFSAQQMTMNGFSAQSGPQEQQTSFPHQAPLPNSYVAQTVHGFSGQVSSVTQTGFGGPAPQPAQQSINFQSNLPGQFNSATQTGFGGPTAHQPAQQFTNYNGNYVQQQQAQAAPSMGPIQQYNNSNFISQNSNSNFISTAPSQHTVPASTALALVPQPAKDNKFETKSTVWADTLNRGLVNLNISGPKTNPLSDIGVDFDAINRREKRMEKPSATTSAVTSTITMGKAMGSGSGIGRAGAGALRPNPTPNPMGMGMGMGYGGGINQPPMAMNMNMGGQNMGMGMNMNMNMGMGQGGAPMGYPPGSNMPGGYNPMMGRGGGYPQQQPYGGGYR